MKSLKKFPFYRQLDQMDCGSTCIRMIAKFYGKTFSAEKVRRVSYVSKDGVSLLGLSNACETLEIKTVGTKISIDQLIKSAPLPCIIPWDFNHFVVVYKTTKSKIYIANPASELESYPIDEFMEHWMGSTDVNSKGYVLLCEPTPDFYELENSQSNQSFRYFFRYLKPHRNLYIQIFFALLFGSLTGIIVPFLTQSVVDVGISNKNLEFIYLILIAQLMFTVGSTVVGFIQSWIGLHVGTRVSLSFLSNFLRKLLNLPFSFFETRTIGDILQRISDNGRVQAFVSSVFFTIIFSILNFIVYSLILSYYSALLFVVFMIGNAFFFAWILVFMKKRREFDKLSFEIGSANETQLVQMVNNVSDIKVNNLERSMRWEWENLQAKGYKLSLKILTWEQIQSSGSILINSIKNVLLSIVSAKAVIEGEMTLGMMLSVQYIIGQLQAPISAFIGLIHQYQDAKISIERLGEVLDQENEEIDSKQTVNYIPPHKSITFENLYFRYGGSDKPLVLKNINCTIQREKITAIVGKSGSGKTSLVKLLLKFYEPNDGSIRIDNFNLDTIANSYWRNQCGAVLQDSAIFSGTIFSNIVFHQDNFNADRLTLAIKIANLGEMIDSLPMGIQTKIGAEGNGISGGQKQRILIARAVYKNPEFLFFDEATSALDSENEKIINERLLEYFDGRTVVIVAHRLSTVKNADRIIVLDQGEIVEVGNHSELISKKSHYFNLVKNQLELG